MKNFQLQHRDPRNEIPRKRDHIHRLTRPYSRRNDTILDSKKKRSLQDTRIVRKGSPAKRGQRGKPGKFLFIVKNIRNHDPLCEQCTSDIRQSGENSRGVAWYSY